MKPGMTQVKIDESKKFFRGMLRDDPTWGTKKEAPARQVKEKLGLTVHWRTVQRHIIDPVLKERAQRRAQTK
jgi:hypothetical protein